MYVNLSKFKLLLVENNKKNSLFLEMKGDKFFVDGERYFIKKIRIADLILYLEKNIIFLNPGEHSTNETKDVIKGKIELSFFYESPEKEFFYSVSGSDEEVLKHFKKIFYILFRKNYN